MPHFGKDCCSYNSSNLDCKINLPIHCGNCIAMVHYKIHAGSQDTVGIRCKVCQPSRHGIWKTRKIIELNGEEYAYILIFLEILIHRYFFGVRRIRLFQFIHQSCNPRTIAAAASYNILLIIEVTATYLSRILSFYILHIISQRAFVSLSKFKVLYFLKHFVLKKTKFRCIDTYILYVCSQLF